MSKRHTASRRRTYGRRQHELHERMDRRTERSRGERAERTGSELELEPMGYLDARATGQPDGFND
jgi:hypothetical protein